MRNPWPSIARTVFEDHNRYLDTYMRPYPGFYFTGDGAARDEHGYIWIKGRVDGKRRDVMCFQDDAYRRIT
jgi:acetyl-CoA synthetase